MEKPPINKIEDKEGDIEKFLTKEEVLIFIESIPGLKNINIIQELYDEKGPYLLDFLGDGDNVGETILCQYVRRRASRTNSKDDRIGAIETKLDIVYYQNGKINDGVEYAEYDEETGRWKIKK